MSVYTVIARRWEHGWELEIRDGEREVGVTQSRSLGSAERMVRDYLALDLDADPASFDIELLPELNGPLANEVREAREATSHAEQVRDEAAARSRVVAQHLLAEGLRKAEIAAVLKVSPQRVSQLLPSAS